MEALTKREAIEECKELWAEIKKSGLTKYGFLNSPDGGKWKAKDYSGNCPLCEYANSAHGSARPCLPCPLVTQYDKRCNELGFTDSGLNKLKWYRMIQGLQV